MAEKQRGAEKITPNLLFCLNSITPKPNSNFKLFGVNLYKERGGVGVCHI